MYGRHLCRLTLGTSKCSLKLLSHQCELLFLCLASIYVANLCCKRCLQDPQRQILRFFVSALYPTQELYVVLIALSLHLFQGLEITGGFTDPSQPSESGSSSNLIGNGDVC